MYLKAPDVLLTCRGEPAVPDADASDTDFAIFVQDGIEAGRDCRDRLGRVKQLQDSQ